jgi:glycerate kinase
MAPVLIRLTAFIFIVYGLAFAASPELMSTLFTGGAPTTPAGITDMRAAYGGVSLGLGVLLALTAKSPTTHLIGLYGVAASMIGMGTTRALGLLLDDSGNPIMYANLALEVAVACVALWAIRNEPSSI